MRVGAFHEQTFSFAELQHQLLLLSLFLTLTHSKSLFVSLSVVLKQWKPVSLAVFFLGDETLSVCLSVSVFVYHFQTR